MDKEQEQLQFLGFIAIFKESIKIIFKKPKIFTQITLAFILPLSCISLTNLQFLSSNNNNNTQVAPPNLFSSNHSITYWLIKAAAVVFGLIFSLLSTAAVVYTVASTHTNTEITFKKIVSVVPKVWKRLMITFLSKFCVIFGYTMIVTISIIVIATIFLVFNTSNLPSNIQAATFILVMIIAVFLGVGLVSMAILWQLANVISVLEKFSGFQAMKRSMNLIKGKKLTAVAIVLATVVGATPFQLLIYKRIGHKYHHKDAGVEILYEILCVVLNSLFILYGVVVQTVFYFVCKSYHREDVDKFILADHLEAFFDGQYVTLKHEAIEIERLQV